MDIYNYDSVTGAYLNKTQADPDPMEGVDGDGNPLAWLIPANAATIPPPTEMPGNDRVFRNGRWGYVKQNEDDSTPTEEPHGPNAIDVVNERQRRLEQGFAYDFGDERGVHFFATTKADMEGWDEVTKLANALIAVGSGDDEISIMTGTGPVQVTAIEWQQVLLRAAQVRQPLFASSFELQYMDPIPSDYADDKYWPTPEEEPEDEQPTGD